MKTFWIRIVNVAAVVIVLLGYNMVIEAREQADEIARLNAELQSFKLEEKEEAEETVYTDGVYTGTAQGFGGDITVEIHIENGKISDVAVISAAQEDGAYLTMAEGIIPDILNAQSADVDTVSGATYSSTGIKNAVAKALEEAKQ